MEGAPESHDVLKERGLLHEWKAGMFAIFVSHQWLGRQHPDPNGEQVAVLRQMLQGLINGSLTVAGDLVSSTYGQGKRLTSETRKQVRGVFKSSYKEHFIEDYKGIVSLANYACSFNFWEGGAKLGLLFFEALLAVASSENVKCFQLRVWL